MLLQDLGSENLTREAAVSFVFPVSTRMITIYIVSCMSLLKFTVNNRNDFTRVSSRVK